MHCAKCHGLLIPIEGYDLHVQGAPFAQWQCLNCAWITDEHIEHNRALKVLPLGDFVPKKGWHKKRPGYAKLAHHPLGMKVVQ